MDTTPDLVILTPVYNEWNIVPRLLADLGLILSSLGKNAHVIAVDDGSYKDFEKNDLSEEPIAGISHVSILRLARNLGHQKAIAIGLAYIHENLPGYPVIVMDSDGEDRPEDIADLYRHYENHTEAVIFAKRVKRSESFTFRVSYKIYQVLFKLLTGEDISFGNFSLISKNVLRKIVHLPEIWNHYAAGIVRAKIPIHQVPIARGKRYGGKSKMGFLGLILHGLSAISVYVEIVSVRLMVVSLLAIMLVGIGFLIVIYFRFFTELAIPGWATNLATGLTIIIFQLLIFQALLSFLILSYRSNKLFVPAKDYADYFLEIITVY